MNIPNNSGGVVSADLDAFLSDLFSTLLSVHSEYCRGACSIGRFLDAFQAFYSALSVSDCPRFAASRPVFDRFASIAENLLEDDDYFNAWRLFRDGCALVDRSGVPGVQGSVEVEDDGVRSPGASGAAPSPRSKRGRRSSASSSPGASAPVVDSYTRGASNSTALEVAPPIEDTQGARPAIPGDNDGAIIDALEEGASVRVVAARFGVPLEEVEEVAASMGRNTPQ